MLYGAEARIVGRHQINKLLATMFIFGGELKQERYLWGGGLGVDGRTILEWTLKR